MPEPHGRADDGDFMCAIVPSISGPIVGKSKDGVFWYVDEYASVGYDSYAPKVVKGEGIFVVLDGPVTFTTDPSEISKVGSYYCAVANTEWGTIPGHANSSGVCWYAHGSKALSTSDFQYVGLKNPDPDPIAEAADAEVMIDYFLLIGVPDPANVIKFS